MPSHQSDPLYAAHAGKVCDEFFDLLKREGELDTPHIREKEIVEMGRLAWAILNLLDVKAGELKKVLQEHPYPDDDGNPDPNSGKCIEELADKLGSLAKDVGEELGQFDDESDPDAWEWEFEVGNRVSFDDMPGTITKIVDNREDIFQIHVEFDDGEEKIFRDMYDLKFISRFTETT